MSESENDTEIEDMNDNTDVEEETETEQVEDMNDNTDVEEETETEQVEEKTTKKKKTKKAKKEKKPRDKNTPTNTMVKDRLMVLNMAIDKLNLIGVDSNDIEDFKKHFDELSNAPKVIKTRSKDEPKLPASTGWSLFSTNHREEFKKNNPDKKIGFNNKKKSESEDKDDDVVTVQMLTTEVSAIWKDMSDAEKKPWNEKAVKIKKEKFNEWGNAWQIHVENNPDLTKEFEVLKDTYSEESLKKMKKTELARYCGIEPEIREKMKYDSTITDMRKLITDYITE